MANKEASVLRIDRLREWMSTEGVDAFIVRNTSDITWLTSFDGVFDEEQAHALLVTADDAWLHTDSRYSEACMREAQGGAVQVSEDADHHADWCVKLLGGKSTLAFDDLMSMRECAAFSRALKSDAPDVTFQPSSDAVLNLRACKDRFELERLQAAQDITDAGFSHIIGFIQPGMTERQVQVELDRFMMENGADGLAFPTIVATGAHGSSPHAQPGEAIIEQGHAIVMDFGARKAGYCSDMTRTVFVGQPSAQLQQAWEVLRRANEECEAMVAPGVLGADVHEHALEVLAQGGFAGRMGHGLGHGVGIDIHEEPVLSPRNTEALFEGAVVTVEPGIYIPGAFGMRLEDTGVVTKDGFKRFSRSTHEMVVI